MSVVIRQRVTSCAAKTHKGLASGSVITLHIPSRGGGPSQAQQIVSNHGSLNETFSALRKQRRHACVPNESARVFKPLPHPLPSHSTPQSAEQRARRRIVHSGKSIPMTLSATVLADDVPAPFYLRLMAPVLWNFIVRVPKSVGGDRLGRKRFSGPPKLQPGQGSWWGSVENLNPVDARRAYQRFRGFIPTLLAEVLFSQHFRPVHHHSKLAGQENRKMNCVVVLQVNPAGPGHSKWAGRQPRMRTGIRPGERGLRVYSP